MNAPNNTFRHLNLNTYHNQLEDFLQSFFWKEKEKIRTEIENLKKLPKWDVLNVQDFDETLYSRVETLKVKWLSNNRWENGNNWILAKYSGILDEEWQKVFWNKKRINYKDKVVLDKSHPTFEKNAKILGEENLSEFIENVLSRIKNLSQEEIRENYKKYWAEYYSAIWKSEKNIWLIGNLDELVINVRSEINLIITATSARELSKIKLQKTWMDGYPYKLVDNPSEKLIVMVKYIKNLWFIPKEIVVNEDKPEYFYRYWMVLSKFLWTKIRVKKIRINNETNNAEIIEERIFDDNDEKSVKNEAFTDTHSSDKAETVYLPWNIS